MDAFDADVLIYAAVPNHPLGRRVLALIQSTVSQHPEPARAIGSLLLVPELLTKPLREDARNELAALAAILARLQLRPLDEATAELAAVLGATHRLRPGDAVHLATAVGAGAERFVTNNRREFRPGLAEIDVVYPVDLPDPAADPGP